MYKSGDFNFDLLNISSHDKTLNFFNIMTANFLLPLITLSTKINTVYDTLIDNIFTNQFHPEFETGNLAISISDQLPSFMVVSNSNQNHLPKKHNIYTENTR